MVQVEYQSASLDEEKAKHITLIIVLTVVGYIQYSDYITVQICI